MATVRVEIEDWLQIIRAEYHEMPGLLLTQPEIERLWGLDPDISKALIDALVVTAGFLRRTPKDGYIRAT